MRNCGNCTFVRTASQLGVAVCLVSPHQWQPCHEASAYMKCASAHGHVLTSYNLLLCRINDILREQRVREGQASAPSHVHTLEHTVLYVCTVHLLCSLVCVTPGHPDPTRHVPCADPRRYESLQPFHTKEPRMRLRSLLLSLEPSCTAALTHPTFRAPPQPTRYPLEKHSFVLVFLQSCHRRHSFTHMHASTTDARQGGSCLQVILPLHASHRTPRHYGMRYKDTQRTEQPDLIPVTLPHTP